MCKHLLPTEMSLIALIAGYKIEKLEYDLRR